MSDFVSVTDRELRTDKSSPRPAGQRIVRAIVHHWAGTGTGGIQRLVHSSDPASANYIIADGQIIGSVPEGRRAWTSGSAAADNPSITIEVQNSAGAPNWPVSAENMSALVRLLAALADRYGWGTLSATNVRGHREFQSTACPGPYLWPRLAQIAADAQQARGGSGGGPSKPAPDPAPSPSSKTVAQMAAEVIAGQHGNGHANRRRSLGISPALYAQVRAEVNRRAGASTPAPAPAPAAKSIAQMAQEVLDGRHGTGHAARRRSLGISAARYEQVRAEVNRRASGGAPARPAGKTVAQMAAEVLRGDHGNGHAARQRSLGISAAQYAQVRAEVNRRA